MASSLIANSEGQYQTYIAPGAGVQLLARKGATNSNTDLAFDGVANSKNNMLYLDGTNGRVGVNNAAPACAFDVVGHAQKTGTNAVTAPAAGTHHIPGVAGVITAAGTQSTNTSEVNLFLGATAVPALTTLSSLAGFALPANSFRSGRVARLRLFGAYTTTGGTATITPAIYYNTASASTKIATGVASGTFVSAAGPFGFVYDAQLTMIDATHILVCANVNLDGANPATGVAGNPGLLSVAAGVVIDPTVAGNISASWTGSNASASNTFQLLGGSIEFLN